MSNLPNIDKDMKDSLKVFCLLFVLFLPVTGYTQGQINRRPTVKSSSSQNSKNTSKDREQPIFKANQAEDKVQNEASALSAFQAGNYDEAAKMYGSLYVEKADNQYKMMVDKCKECLINIKNGFRAKSQREYAEAMEYFNKVLSLNPQDERISIEIEMIKPWVNNKYLEGCLIFQKSDEVFLAVLPIPDTQIKCNRDEARDESIKCQQGGLTDWRIPSVNEMKIILREIPSEQLGGDVFWVGDYNRAIRILRDPRTNEVTSKEYVQYNATCMDKTGRLNRIDRPAFLANYFLVRDFDNSCIPCPRTMYKETR